MAKNDKCVVSDSTVCKWLDRDCSECYIQKIKDVEDAEKILENFEVTLSLLPDRFDELQGETCCFCKHEKKPRERYAVIDLAHSEPEYKKGAIFGFGKKVRQAIGSLMTVSVSTCKDCTRSLRTIETLKWLLPTVLLAISLVVVLIPGLSDTMRALHTLVPYGVVIGAGIVGYIAGRTAAWLYAKSKTEQMYLNVLQVPICKEMIEHGWFTLQDSRPIRFSKKSCTRKVADIK